MVGIWLCFYYTAEKCSVSVFYLFGDYLYFSSVLFMREVGNNNPMVYIYARKKAFQAGNMK